MSLQILKTRRTVEGIDYLRKFDFIGHTGWGFAFDCDQLGVLAPLGNPTAQANLDACLAGTNGTVDRGVVALPYRHHLPAEGRCPCGRTVVLDGDVDCDCGRLFNSSGQELNPRWMWGEETGEWFGNPPGGDY